MGSSYINLLTDEQIKEFIESMYPTDEAYKSNISRIGDIVIAFVDKNDGEKIKPITLYDFNSVGCKDSSIWIKYLYHIFGEEYKEAYLDMCAKVFE